MDTIKTQPFDQLRVMNDHAAIKAELDHLRSLLPPSVQMTSYLYQVGIGISEIMDPNGWPTGYSYDAFGRLQAITDHHGDLLTEYDNATALESK